MNNYLLYKDSKQKIEIDGYFHQILNQIAIKTIKLERNQLAYLTDLIFLQLEKRKIKINKPIISKIAPIIQYTKFFTLSSPFAIFSEPLDYLCMTVPAIDELSTIAQEIENFSQQEQRFYCGFFEQNFYGVNGWLVSNNSKEDNAYILFFNLSEDNNNFITF